MFIFSWTIFKQRIWGFDKDQVLEIANMNLNPPHFEAFRNVLLGYSNIQMVSLGSVPGLKANLATHQQEDGSVIVCHQYSVDYGYLDVMGIKLVSGRFFLPDHPTDKDAMVVNQAYLDQMNPRHIEGSNIIGVVQDFHALSLHQKIDPVKMQLRTDWRGNVLVRFGKGDVREMMAFIEQTWKGWTPEKMAKS